MCAHISAHDGYLLRPWAPEQAHVLLAAWHDSAIAEWNPVPPEPSIELAQSWINGTAEQNEASIGIDVVMVDAGVEPDGGTGSGESVAGEIGLQVDPAQGVAEVGFWLAEGSRGKGRAKTLLRLAEALANELELKGLVALVEPENERAIKALQDSGWPELPTKTNRRAFAQRVSR